MIWAKEETFSRSEIEQLQLQRLQKQVAYSYARVAPYREKMDAMGVKPEDIKSLMDTQKLPFTTKADFRDNYPMGLFAVEKKELVRIHASSGTTGKPTIVGYTQNDMRNWTETVARIAAMGGADSEDVAQICFGYGLFTGALGLHFGLEKIGATVIPSSVGNTEKQIMFMQDLASTLLIATPSYALHLAEAVMDIGLDPRKDLHLRKGLFGGEGMSERMRRQLHDIWGDEALFTQNYGMSELNGPGVSGECEQLCGMHIQEDHFLAEVIDPESGEVLPRGEKGELVITCLTKESLPLIRYRTKDLTRLFYEPCACGRTMVRMENLSGRSDDMLIIRGVNVFPSQIEEVLSKITAISPLYEIELERIEHLDHMTIRVELKDNSLLDSYAALEALNAGIRQKIRQALGLDARVELVNPRSLKRFEGKAKRVTDKRNI